MTKTYHPLIAMFVLLSAFIAMSCDQLASYTAHQLVFEDDVYLRGTTSSEGYVNLNDHEFWQNYKNRIDEITDVEIYYQITRNGTSGDLSASFYFGELFPNTFLGSAYIAEGHTSSGLEVLTLDEGAEDALINLVMTVEAFWYSVQGNSENADVDFEPVRVVVHGTFDVP